MQNSNNQSFCALSELLTHQIDEQKNFSCHLNIFMSLKYFRVICYVAIVNGSFMLKISKTKYVFSVFQSNKRSYPFYLQHFSCFHQTTHFLAYIISVFLTDLLLPTLKQDHSFQYKKLIIFPTSCSSSYSRITVYYS